MPKIEAKIKRTLHIELCSHIFSFDNNKDENKDLNDLENTYPIHEYNKLIGW